MRNIVREEFRKRCQPRSKYVSRSIQCLHLYNRNQCFVVSYAGNVKISFNSTFVLQICLICLYFVAASEELGDSVSTTLPSTPTELSQFPKLCDLRRKFPVLYRVEFQVRYILWNNLASTALFQIHQKLVPSLCTGRDKGRLHLRISNLKIHLLYVDLSHISSPIVSNEGILGNFQSSWAEPVPDLWFF